MLDERQEQKLIAELYNREAVRSAKLVSNPGCYATNTQMLLAPLLPYIDPANPPTVMGVSGYSGAGTVSSGKRTDGTRPETLPKITPESLAGGVRPYALTDHIHEREARTHLGELAGQEIKLAFTPMVAPWFQGIISTASIPLREKLTSKQVKELYEQKYGNEPLVEIRSAVPEIKDIVLKHGFKVGGFQVHSNGDRVGVVGGIDNLLKGAATQCLQNLNLALGLDEFAGIPTA